MTIGERIKQLRLKQGMTQTELAIKIGTTKQAIYKYENGIVTNIPIERLEQIADALNEPLFRLIGTEYHTPDVLDKIETFLNYTVTDDEEFTRRLFHVLANLPVEGWKHMVDIARELEKQTPSTDVTNTPPDTDGKEDD